MLHLKVTMMILFANVFLTILMPGSVLAGNIFYDNTPSGYQVDNSIIQASGDLNPNQGGLDVNTIGLVDVIKLLVGVIDLLIRILFASLFVAYALPGVLVLLVGIPLVLAYSFAIWGFIR